MDNSKTAGLVRRKSVVLVTPQVWAVKTWHVSCNRRVTVLQYVQCTVDFIHKDSCTKHLDSNVHTRKAPNVEGNKSHEAKKRKLQASIPGIFAKQTAQQQLRLLELM